MIWVIQNNEEKQTKNFAKNSKENPKVIEIIIMDINKNKTNRTKKQTNERRMNKNDDRKP